MKTDTVTGPLERDVRRQQDDVGVCVIVGGVIVAWFANFDDAAEQWCTENHFGEWLAWRATPPVPVPMTDAERAECELAAEKLIAAARFE